MSGLTYPTPPATYTTEQAALRVWTIRQLRRERAIDLYAADTALRTLREHANARIRSLALFTTLELSRELVHG